MIEFEGIAKTNTTHTQSFQKEANHGFEGIAKTNTTHTIARRQRLTGLFEGIAKTNTTHTHHPIDISLQRLRVLLKQILPTLWVS